MLLTLRLERPPPIAIFTPAVSGRCHVSDNGCRKTSAEDGFRHRAISLLTTQLRLDANCSLAKRAPAIGPRPGRAASPLIYKGLVAAYGTHGGGANPVAVSR